MKFLEMSSCHNLIRDSKDESAWDSNKYDAR